MGMIFEFHLCRPGFRRARLFARPDGAKIWLLKLGIAQIVGIPTELFSVAQEIVDQHLTPGEYLVGREAQLRAKRDGLYTKAREEAEHELQERLDWWKEEVDKADARRRRAQAELEAHRASLLTLSRLVASVFPEGAVVEGGAITQAAADVLAERQHEVPHHAYDTQDEAQAAAEEMVRTALSFMAYALAQRGKQFEDEGERAALEQVARDVWPGYADRFLPEELAGDHENFSRAHLVRALAYGLAAAELGDTKVGVHDGVAP
jgi:hypothetical protein